jgi:phosphoribosyl 1,2-cyclic phosphodiesterase
VFSLLQRTSKILIDGGLSARQMVLRLEQCGVMAEQVDGVLLTHKQGDHIFGPEVVCRKFAVPIYCKAWSLLPTDAMATRRLLQ